MHERPKHISGGKKKKNIINSLPAEFSKRVLVDEKGPYVICGQLRPWISLHICTGWSGPALSTYRINGYCSMCRRTTNVQIRLHGCACRSRPSLLPYGIKAFFSLRIICFLKKAVYHIYPKYWDRQARENCTDPDQMPQSSAIFKHITGNEFVYFRTSQVMC